MNIKERKYILHTLLFDKCQIDGTYKRYKIDTR